jgi:DNA-directed RNA polymerase subunit RPC12/RpoP
MSITILDYVKAKIGDQDTYSEHDHRHAGVAILGGCQRCHATIASYNAYPSTSGYWRCANCLGDTGFATIEAFEHFQARPAARCPACGNTDTISETRITTSERTEEYALECGDCGGTWQP